jgi:hypothetical protein
VVDGYQASTRRMRVRMTSASSRKPGEDTGKSTSWTATSSGRVRGEVTPAAKIGIGGTVKPGYDGRAGQRDLGRKPRTPFELDMQGATLLGRRTRGQRPRRAWKSSVADSTLCEYDRCSPEPDAGHIPPMFPPTYDFALRVPGGPTHTYFCDESILRLGPRMWRSPTNLSSSSFYHAYGVLSIMSFQTSERDQ